MQRYEWDAGNLRHIARHGVTLTECEEALVDPQRVPGAAHAGPTGEARWAVVGATVAGRVLQVVYTFRGAVYRVVTAHDATPRQARDYPAALSNEEDEDD